MRSESIGQSQIATTFTAPSSIEKLKSAISSAAHSISAAIKDVFKDIGNKPLTYKSVTEKNAGSILNDLPVLEKGSKDNATAMNRLDHIIANSGKFEKLDIQTALHAGVFSAWKEEMETGIQLHKEAKIFASLPQGNSKINTEIAAHSKRLEQLNEMLASGADLSLEYMNGMDSMQPIIADHTLREIMGGKDDASLNGLRQDLAQHVLLASADLKMEESIKLNGGKLPEDGAGIKILKGIANAIETMAVFIKFLAS